MADKIKWGILGLGTIARKFATGLKAVADAELTAVGSRSREKAEKFGQEFGAARCYDSYEELVADPELDVIYVATPHTFHKEHTLLALRAKKAVLCEKPLAVNAIEAEEMIDTARKMGCFLMEAHWTRFLPAIRQVKQWIDEGAIGEVRMLQADFGGRSELNPTGRLFNPELAGGALLDVGVYPLSLAAMIFGWRPERITSLAHIGETGVDEQSAVILGYAQGQLALLSSAIRTTTCQEAHIYGTKGSIHVPDFWHACQATLSIAGQEPQHVQLPMQGNGYNYEAEEVQRCLRAGQIESEEMSHSESLCLMQTADAIRKQWGLKYPVE